MSGKTNILIVDDDRHLRRTLSDILTAKGYVAASAATGEAALAEVRQEKPAVALIDLRLEDMSGLQVVEGIKKHSPGTECIVLTGYASQVSAIEAINLGVYSYVQKPYDIEQLLVTIRRAIEKREAEEALQQRNRELALLHRASQALISSLNLNDVLVMVLREARGLLDATGASVWLRDAETGELVCSQAAGPQSEIVIGRRLPPGEGIAGWVARHGESLLVPDTRAEERYFEQVEQQTGLETRSILSIPLRVQEKVVGVLQVVDAVANRFDPADLRSVEQLAATAAIAIENAGLYEEAERLRAFNENIVQSMEEGVLLEDFHGNITFANPKAAALLGYTPAELIGQHWTAIVVPERAPEVEVEAARRPQGIASRYETVLLTKGGMRVPVIVSARPLFDKALNPGEDGRFVGVLTTFTDITDRKQAEEALQRYAERLRILHAIDGAILAAWSPEEIARAALRPICHLVPCSRANIVLFDGEGKSQEATVLATYADDETRLGGGARVSVDLSSVEELAQGTVRIVKDITALPRPSPLVQMFQAGGVQAYVSVPLITRGGLIGSLNLGTDRPGAFVSEHLDIAREIANQIAVGLDQARLRQEVHQHVVELERRVDERTADLSAANAELARASRLKDEFLAGMSHELRTPLNAILGLCESLQEGVYGPVNQRQQKSLRVIEESGQHLLSLINDILDVSKIEAGKLELEPGPISVELVCQASLGLIKQSAQKKQLKVSSALDRTVEAIWADERRLKQLLVNLLSNAVKFTPDGGIIGLDVVGDVEREVVHFTVWDTGIGISQEDMDRLFQPFVQLDSRLSREHAGTGLGLALVRRLAELHGGGVSMESQVGKGSRFTVSLPWKPAEMAVPIGEAEPGERGTPGPLAISRALIIDDSSAATSQLTRYLGRLGIEAVVHSRGEGVVDKALETAPDVIILDILLPDLPGWDVLEQLKAEPGTRDIPVLIVSVVDDRRRGLAMGAAGYLVKPVSWERLQRALAQIMPQGVKAHEPSVVASREVEAQVSAPTRTDRPLVLLAEDNDVNIEAFSEYLLTRGYRVVVARNGIEALDRAGEERPDLILMDIQMPVMDGLEAIRRIRADVDPATGLKTSLAGVPIVALTALAMPGDREKCLEAGADEYLSKPVGLKQLVGAIEAQLGARAPA